MDRLTGMEIFVRVVEEAGFSAAARELKLSKSAVSKQITALEERLGARLLNRTTRRLSLTDAGAAYYERAIRILSEAEEAEAVVSHLSSAPHGLLKVNAPVTFGTKHLSSLLPEFMDRFPGISIDLTLNDRVVDLIEEGFDMAVRIARLPDSSLIARRLCCSRRIVVASPDYIARHGAPRTPQDLKQHECFRYAYQLLGDEWNLTGPDGKEERVRVSGRLRANNGEALRGGLLAGKGIAYSPTFMLGTDLSEGRLVRLLPEWEDSKGGIYAIYPHARFVPAKVRAFVDFLAERFTGIPEWEKGLLIPG